MICCSRARYLRRGDDEFELLQRAAEPQFQYAPATLGVLTLEATGFSSHQGPQFHDRRAFDFPFTANFLTTSGLETFGDNQFATAITAFPIARDQQKYQLRYDVSHSRGKHAMRFGVNLIHEPVLRGALAGNAEMLFSYPQDPSFIQQIRRFWRIVRIRCQRIPSQFSGLSDRERFGRERWRFFAKQPAAGLVRGRCLAGDAVVYRQCGLRYDTTFGLFVASGHDQAANPALAALQLSGSTLVSGIPHDYRKAFAPRVGIAYAPNASATTVFRAGAGLYYNDLAQNGWVDALTAVNDFNLQNAAGRGR